MSKGLPSVKKRLIVNADDFGLHASINEAVETAHVRGMLTSASLMACGASFADAVAIARRNPRLGVGVHLVLVDEKPLLPAGKVPSLVNKRGAFPGHTELLIRIIQGRTDLNEIAAECEAQIAKIFDAGLTPTHIDSHQHVHLLPPVLRAMKPVMKKFGIRKMRLLNAPFSDYKWFNIKKSAFALFARFSMNAERSGCVGPDNFYGFFNSGAVDKPYLKALLPGMSSGVAELSLHPGTDNTRICQQYGSWRTRYGWRCDWKGEFDLLLDREAKDMIAQNGVSIIHYGDIKD